MLAGFHFADLRSGGVDVFGEGGDFGVKARLIGIHKGHAAGEDDAQAGAKIVADRSEALRLGRLTLEGVHLPGDFLEDVVDAGEVLFGGLETKLGEALLGLEAGDARGFFNDGAAVVRLGAEELADALLADDGVAFRAEAGAHEDVLNVAQAAELAVEEVFAFAGAEEAAGDDDFALVKGALELAAANLEDDGLRARGTCVCGWRGCGRLRGGRCRGSVAFFDDLAGLLGADDLLGLDGARTAELIFIPVGGAIGIDFDSPARRGWGLRRPRDRPW